MKMKKKNILSLVLALTLVAALAVGGTLAYFTDNDTETNTFTMGKVDINLKESNENDTNGNPVWDEDGLEYENVLPGAKPDKLARVEVLSGSADCYIMVKVDLNSEDMWDEQAQTGFTAADFDALYTAVKTAIDDTKWTVTEVGTGADKYLQCVYKTVAKEGDNLDLFSAIEIPKSFTNNTAGKTFTIDLKAYAIQSENNVALDSIDWNQAFEIYPVPTKAPEAPAEP